MASKIRKKIYLFLGLLLSVGNSVGAATAFAAINQTVEVYENVHNQLKVIKDALEKSRELESKNLKDEYKNLFLFAIHLVEAIWQESFSFNDETENGESETDIILKAFDSFSESMDSFYYVPMIPRHKLEYRNFIEGYINEKGGVDGFLFALIFETYPYWHLSHSMKESVGTPFFLPSNDEPNYFN